MPKSHKFKKIALKNGLRIVLAPQKSAAAASVLILVKAGSEYESKDTNGISHFLEHMMFKGTTNRPRLGETVEELSTLGSKYNAFTSQEYTGYYAKVASRNILKAVEIVSDLYLNPLFLQAEIDKERGVVIEEMNMYEDMPMNRVNDLFGDLLYHGQPAGWPVDGRKEIIRKISRDDFIKYRNERYLASNTVVIVAGKFPEKEAVRKIEKTFGHLPLRRSAPKTKTFGSQSSPRVAVKFKESDQAHLVIGFRAFDTFDKRRYAIQVLADILGGGMSSRLFKRIRDELGAAYYIHSYADLSLDHGDFVINSGADRTRVELVIKAILEECKKIMKTAPDAKELKRSKDFMVGNMFLELETSDELAGFYGMQETIAGKMLSPDEIVRKINSVTAEEVRSVARDIFKNNGLNMAIIGPYKNKKPFEKLLTLK